MASGTAKKTPKTCAHGAHVTAEHSSNPLKKLGHERGGGRKRWGTFPTRLFFSGIQHDRIALHVFFSGLPARGGFRPPAPSMG
jgi:hypothetical protein